MNIEELMAEAHERDGEYKEALDLYVKLNNENVKCYNHKIHQLKDKVGDGYRPRVPNGY